VGGRPGTRLFLGVTRWETEKVLGLEFLEQRASEHGVSRVLMVQCRVGDVGEASPPVGSRGGVPVGRLRDEVSQNLKHFCILLNINNAQ